MNFTAILDAVQEYISNYYLPYNKKLLKYHNLQRTNYVLENASKIAKYYNLTEQEKFVVFCAVWFHDVGYLSNGIENEEQSVKLAVDFLSNQQVHATIIDMVIKSINAVSKPQLPGSLLEQIICDADLFYLGTEDFFRSNKQLFQEYNASSKVAVDKSYWQIKTISFLQHHRYHTEYCQSLLNSKKEQNLERLKKKVLTGEIQNIANSNADLGTEEKEISPIKINKKNLRDAPGKGVETMFKISSTNHQKLSDMADKKAHILITVNSIILSAIISLVLRKIVENRYLLYPSLILLIVSLLAMIFSILSTRPSLAKGSLLRSGIDNKTSNLLFFGNFYKMSLEDFDYGMRKMMADEDFLYGSLIKDIHAQGQVLGKKYKLLRLAYNIFMYGLVASVTAFIIAALIYNESLLKTK